jgi:Co/Zn/Cd efflux system component
VLSSASLTVTSATSISSRGVHRRVKKVDKNFNMISAWTHVGGDTLRTLAVFAAAVISSITGIDGDICDAWAAIVSGCTIIVSIYLISRNLFSSLICIFITVNRSFWGT